MYSVIDLFYSFLIAIFFIMLFKLHKELFSVVYFSMSDILSDITHRSPTRKAVLIRFVMILSYGVILRVFLIDQKNITLGMTLGAALIVWPVFLSDENIIEELRDKKLLLRFMLFLFIIITFVTSKIAINIFDLGYEVTSIYIKDLDKKRIVDMTGDTIISTVLLWLLGMMYSRFKKILNGKVSFNEHIEDEEPAQEQKTYVSDNLVEDEKHEKKK